VHRGGLTGARSPGSTSASGASATPLFTTSIGGGIIQVVIGSNGANQIRAEGATGSEAWRRALDQAAEVGMLPGRPRPARE
jgi:hypothetical protein